ncbi:MAG: hypothetical protein AB4290_15405 [Spirulina sp.]
MISFLNILVYEGRSQIQDSDIFDPYTGGSTVDLKDAYLDIKVVLFDGTIVIKELLLSNLEE